MGKDQSWFPSGTGQVTLMVIEVAADNDDGAFTMKKESYFQNGKMLSFIVAFIYMFAL